MQCCGILSCSVTPRQPLSPKTWMLFSMYDSNMAEGNEKQSYGRLQACGRAGQSTDSRITALLYALSLLDVQK